MLPELDVYIRDELQDLGWIVKSPSRDESGQVWARTQFRSEPRIDARLNGYRPRSIVKLGNDKLWVINAGDDRNSIEQTLSEAEEHVARRLSADGQLTVPLISGVAGNDSTGYEVRTRLLVKNRYRPVIINGSEATGLLDPAPILKLVESGNPVIKDLIVNEDLFLKKAERINRHLHAGGINKNDRAKLMAALLLALSESEPVQVGGSLTALVKEINARTLKALDRHDKKTFYRFVEIQSPTSLENHEGFRHAVVHTMQELTNLNIRSAMNSGTDVLGKFYEVFLKYGNGAREIGIVLTPRHLTRFAIETLGVGSNDIVLDPACGTGGFLVAAFDHVRRSATPKTIERFRRLNLFGIERESAVAALAIVNMIFRGDGNTNIVEGNCFSRHLRKATSQGHPTATYVKDRSPSDEAPVTRVFMNPPFALKQSEEQEYKFIDEALRNMADGGLLFAIVPMSVMVEGGHTAEWRRNSLLADNTLVSVISMTRDVFYPVDVVPIALIVRKGTPHPARRKVLWARVLRDGFDKSKRRRIPSAVGSANDLNVIQPILQGFIQDHTVRVEPIPGLLCVAPIDFNDPIIELVPEAFLASPASDTAVLMANLDRQVRENVEVLVALDFRFGGRERATIVDAARGAASPPRAQSPTRAPSRMSPVAIEEIFDLFAGDFHSLNDLNPGEVPVVSCADDGAADVAGFDVSRRYVYSDCLTIAFNGRPLTTQIHPYEFAAKDDVAVAVPKTALPIEAIVYIQTVLNAERWRFSYSRKCFMAKLRRLTVTLPTTADGLLDVEQMMGTVRAQPYWWFLAPRLAEWRPRRPLAADEDYVKTSVEELANGSTDALADISTEELRPIFSGMDESNVAEILRAYPSIVSILHQSKPHIQSNFGAEARVLLRAELEYGGNATLYAMITGPGTDEALFANLDRFDDTWWLTLAIPDPVVFTVGRA
jgi:hypothetical protein